MFCCWKCWVASRLLVLTNCISSVGIWLVFGFVGFFDRFPVVLPDISTWVIWLCFSHYLRFNHGLPNTSKFITSMLNTKI